MTEQKQPLPGLLDEPIIAFYPSLAKRVGGGANIALVLQQLHFLLAITEKAKNENNFKDGYWWVYNSYAQWKEEHFTWMSISSIRRAFDFLENTEGIVRSAILDPKHPNRKYYRISYDQWTEWYYNLDWVVKGPGVQNEQLKLNKTPAQNEQPSITDTTQKDSTGAKTAPGGDTSPSKKEGQPLEGPLAPWQPANIFEFVLESMYGVQYAPGMKLNKRHQGHSNAVVGALKALSPTPTIGIVRAAYDAHELAKPRDVDAWCGVVMRYYNGGAKADRRMVVNADGVKVPYSEAIKQRRV